jgi:DNA-directed RNA polymerase specialized sigma24 family protein
LETGFGSDPECMAFLETCFREEYKDMLLFASSLLGDRTQAETAVQDTFVTALEKREQFLKSPSPVGFLYNTLKYKIKRMIRDRQKLLSLVLTLDDSPDLAVPCTAVNHLSYSAIAKDPDLALLCRFYLEGYSLRELAQERGVSIAACKMKIRRAKDRVIKRYELSADE